MEFFFSSRKLEELLTVGFVSRSGLCVSSLLLFLRSTLKKALLGFAAFAYMACRAASGVPTVDLTLISASDKKLGSFTAELAADNQERAKGLMFRRELGAQEAMLFLFPEERRLSFWMKNTLIPLDMIFISKDWRVAGIVENAPPLTEEPRGIESLSQYVLEVSGGTCSRLGLAVGDRVSVNGRLPHAN
jgi:uncharacterized membrane protein (UPF0127 family)